MSRLLLILGLLLVCGLNLLAPVGCVKEDPKDKLILGKVQEDLQKNYDPAIMTKVTKWEVFNENLKVWLAPDFDAKEFKKFGDKAARAFGTISRTNDKIYTDYVVKAYQEQKNMATGKETEVNVFESTFHNGKETVDTNLFGQGDGRFDYPQ